MTRNTSKIGREIRDAFVDTDKGKSGKTRRGDKTQHNQQLEGTGVSSIRTAGGNLGDCRGVTWQMMEKRFIAAYAGVEGYSEHQLVQISRRWRSITKRAMKNRL